MKKVGLIGYPVAHSRSPQMHNAAFQTLAIDARYELWETPQHQLEERIASLRSPDMLGANVTIPYKEQVVGLIDECDALATHIGAVNTIVNRNGRLVGYNTDAPGFIRALAECPGHPFDSQGKKTVILGTGGAARAAAVALIEHGAASVSILGRNTDRVDALLDHLHALISVGAQFIAPSSSRIDNDGGRSDDPSKINGGDGNVRRATQASQPHIHTAPAPTEYLPIIVGDVNGALLGSPEAKAYLQMADLVVNATSVGLKSDDTTLLIDVSLLPVGSLVMDMVFSAEFTPLLRAAQAHGCFVFNGLSMLLYQGTLAFELWTGHDAPVDVMRTALGIV
jgi:shikimate dehydrogenase